MSDGTEKTKEKPEPKSDVTKLGPTDAFIVEHVFPEAAAVFTSPARSIQEAKDSAVIIVDTNALLVPYGIGSQTLSQIEATYTRLLAEKRLVIPAQVAREFARNRATKLSELFQKLSRQRDSRPHFNQGAYPMLEGLEDYKRLRQIEKQLDSLLDEYGSTIGALIERVKAWEWNDPVSLLYGRLFPAEVVIDTSKKRDQIHKEHLHRFLHKIPPGYKDGSKDDQGVGDFLIWLTILEVGAARKRSVVFVSGEEKPDWFYRSDRQALYPRFELVDEFRRASGGNSFHIIKFSELLEMLGANDAVVAEVRQEERATAAAVPITPHAAAYERAFEAERAVAKWFMENGYEVVAASMPDGYDYLIRKNEDVYCVDVLYARSPQLLSHRMRSRAAALSSRATGGPNMLVVVGEDAAVAADAVRLAKKIGISMRMIFGIIAADGRFQAHAEM